MQKVLHIWQSMRTVPTSAPSPKFMKPEELDALVAAMGGKPGDLLLFAADKDKVVFDVLGNLRLREWLVSGLTFFFKRRMISSSCG